ncbi:MAG TPA: FtsX-like permease family protein [Hyphomonadaceae bacterium]|jgi:putative ABC transport system permease protein|nr:FtsX-like permease family protein [Hyphomonadaceae bacterium]
MILHWLSASWRSLIANPLFSLITIVSLSIGCCGALLAGANIKQHMSFEQGFANADDIVLVRTRSGPNPSSKHPMAQGNRFARAGTFDYTVNPGLEPLIEGKLRDVEAMTMVASVSSPLADERGEPTKDEAVVVDRSFFDVFEYRFVEGTKETAFATPESIVLTKDRARALFGDQPALGKTLQGVKGATLRVGAVIEPPPQPTMFDYTVISGVAETGAAAANYTAFGRILTGGLYIRIKPGVDRSAFIAEADPIIHAIYLEGFKTILPRMSAQVAEGGMPPMSLEDFLIEVSAIPLTQIHLAPRETTGIVSTGEISMLLVLGSAALALLAVSGFNYVVLSLARALRRRREVGVRKVLGASTGAITRHYLAEAGLLTAISLFLGFALAELLQPWFARTLGQPEFLFNLYDPAFLLAVTIAFFTLVVLVGAYPALYLANIRPRTGLEDAEDGGGGLRRHITNGLLGLQIAAATVLLATALTMVAQARYVAARPLGFNATNLYSIRTPCPVAMSAVKASFSPSCTATLNRVAHETPGIKRVAWSTNPGVFTTGAPSPITIPGRPGVAGEGFSMAVDTEFLSVAGARLLAGRMFDPNSARDRILMDAFPDYPKQKFEGVPVVVTRAMLSVVGANTPEQALGKRFMIANSFWTTSYEIIGVVEDWHQRSLKFAVSPIVFIPGGTLMWVIAEIDDKDFPSVLQALTPPEGFAYERGTFHLEVASLAQSFQNAYAADRNMMGAVIGFAMLAIFVACLGVYGLSSFDMRRRVREVGIRKALGASPARVAGAMFWRQMRFAGMASLLAWPVAWWVSSAWLETYVYRTSLGPVVLPAASLIILAFVALAVGFNTARAAAIRPSFALRTAA